jgi:hypothetical protein
MNVSRTARLEPPMTESRNRGVIQQLAPSALLHLRGDYPAGLSINVHQDDAMPCRMPTVCIDRILRPRRVNRGRLNFSFGRR